MTEQLGSPSDKSSKDRTSGGGPWTERESMYVATVMVAAYNTKSERASASRVGIVTSPPHFLFAVLSYCFN
jgi:hypothetical protein